MKNLGFKNFDHKIFLKSFFHKKESQSDRLFTLLCLFCFAIVPLALLSGGNIIGTIFYLAYAYLLFFIIHNNKTIINGGTKGAHFFKIFFFLLAIPIGIANIFIDETYVGYSSSNQNKEFINYYTHKDNPDVIVCEYVIDNARYVKEYIGVDTGFCYETSRGRKGRKVNPNTYYRGKFN